MINLVKGQEVKGTQFVVLESGAFNPVDLVPVANINDPDVSCCAYEANFIQHGVNYEDMTQMNKRTFSKFEFRELFTIQERIALDNYEDNQNLSEQQKDILKTLFVDFDAAEFIDIDNANTQTALALFVQFGLITQERLLEILNNV